MSVEAQIHLNKFKPRPYQLKSCQAFESGKYTKFIDIEPRRAGKDFKYDSSFGLVRISLDLYLVGKDWWLERHEYDGSEWWEYKEYPLIPEKTVNQLDFIEK